MGFALATRLHPANEPRGLTSPGRRFRMLGIEVDGLTLDDLQAVIDEAVRLDRRILVTHHNLHSVYMFHRSARMRDAYAMATRTVIDGMPLVFAGRMLGHPLHRRHRLAVLDWINPMMAAAAAKGWRVFALAGEPGVAQRAASLLCQQLTDLTIETAHGYFDIRPGSAESEAILARINAYRPHLLLVGMGMPRQEEWIADNFPRLRANVTLSVGAALDYVAGEIPTPPRWTGQVGVEWLVRLMTTPSRTARRYLVEPWSLLPLLASDLRMGRTRMVGRPVSRPAARPAPATAQVLGVGVNLSTMDELTETVSRAIARNEHHVVANHNLHSVYLYHRRPLMRAMYARASHTFIEGMSLVAAGRLLGVPVRRAHRIAVLDWIDPLMQQAAAAGWRVFVLGGKPGVSQRGAKVLSCRHRGLLIDAADGYFDATPGSSQNDAMLARINGYRPHLLLIGMGMPRQEEWIEANADRLTANVVLHVGGLMDCVSREIPTAPRWLGQAGLEWLFRLAVTPRRTARRYLIEPWTLLPLLIKETVACRRSWSRS